MNEAHGTVMHRGLCYWRQVNASPRTPGSYFHRRGRDGAYIFLHRIIAQESLGASVTRGMLVHHKNGVTTDNAPSNLAPIALAAHTSLPHRGKPKTPEWRAKIALGLLGHMVSPETRAKISAKLRGRPRNRRA